MTEVTFIHDVDDRLRAAANWLAAAPQIAAGVAVFVPDIQHAAHLDRLLWEQHPTGFAPHCCSEHPLSAQTPIVLCGEPPPQWPHATLLNLSNELPQRLTNVRHLVEMVSQDEATRVAGRARYRSYQQAGMRVDTRKAGKDELA
jgi:DNA polymerase-3 subunit chi